MMTNDQNITVHNVQYVPVHLMCVCVCVCHFTPSLSIKMDDVTPRLEFCPHCSHRLLTTRQFIIGGTSCDEIVVGMFALCAFGMDESCILHYTVSMKKHDPSTPGETHERYPPARCLLDT